MSLKPNRAGLRSELSADLHGGIARRVSQTHVGQGDEKGNRRGRRQPPTPVEPFRRSLSGRFFQTLDEENRDGRRHRKKTLHVQFTNAANVKVPRIQSATSQCSAVRPLTTARSAIQRIRTPQVVNRAVCRAIDHVNSWDMCRAASDRRDEIHFKQIVIRPTSPVAATNPRFDKNQGAQQITGSNDPPVYARATIVFEPATSSHEPRTDGAFAK
jgi:hypothetical protein